MTVSDTVTTGLFDFTAFRSAFSRVDMPDEDRELSPFTGLTRRHWAAVADDLLLSAARYRSPGGSRIDLPGKVSQQGMRTDGIEGFARTFLLAAFRSVGEHGADPHDHLSRYLEGVVAGTRTPGRDDADSWPVIGHIGREGQPHVEAASIALSMHLTRSRTWDVLAPQEQDRVDAWLRPALGREPSSNNWYLFPLTIASFLEGVGRGDAETAYVIDRGLRLIEIWYRGEGWYSDGDGDAFDHYIGWALHLYPMLHARLRGLDDLERKLGDRLETFLETFARTFDRNGSPLHQGRSLTYRMATLAAVASGEVFGRTPLAHGQSRRILSSTLRYFFERGATTDGVFSLGWHGEYEPVVQRYSGPGSPYWASKGFGALMLPADHPVWTAREQALEADEHDYVKTIAPVGWMIQATASDGLVRVHNHGSDHLKPFDGDSGVPDPLYNRTAYSTRTGPTPLHMPSDNDAQVEFRDTWSVRRRVHRTAAGPGWVASWHEPRFTIYAPFTASDAAGGGPVLPSARVQTVTAATGRAEVRVVRLRMVPPGSRVRASGWAVAGELVEDVERDVSGVAAVVRASGLTSQLVGLHGWHDAGTAHSSYGTAFGRWAALPELFGTASQELFVAAASLTGEQEPVDVGELVEVRVEGQVVTIGWAEKREPLVLDLDSLPWG